MKENNKLQYKVLTIIMIPLYFLAFDAISWDRAAPKAIPKGYKFGHVRPSPSLKILPPPIRGKIIMQHDIEKKPPKIKFGQIETIKFGDENKSLTTRSTKK
jgi:hypothetical protein